MKNQKGFTLVELLAAMAIIAILIGLAVFGVNLAQRSARDTQRRGVTSDLSLLVQSYYETNSSYPVTMTCTTTAVGISGVTDTIPVKGPTGCLGLGNGTATPAGTYYTYGTTTSGYKLCVRLENSTWFNGGTDKAATCP